MSGYGWKSIIYDTEWLGDINGYKYIFPDAPIKGNEPDTFLWYESFKNGCTLNDGCGYNFETI